MTVIVVDKDYVVWESMGFTPSGIHVPFPNKVELLEKRYIVGAAGSAFENRVALNYYKEMLGQLESIPEKPKDPPADNWEFFVLDLEDTSKVFYATDDDYPNWFYRPTPIFVGSGGVRAHTLMSVRYKSTDAVKLTCTMDPGCDGPVYYFDYRDPQNVKKYVANPPNRANTWKGSKIVDVNSACFHLCL
jgi:hypothetical protein